MKVSMNLKVTFELDGKVISEQIYDIENTLSVFNPTPYDKLKWRDALRILADEKNVKGLNFQRFKYLYDFFATNETNNNWSAMWDSDKTFGEFRQYYNSNKPIIKYELGNKMFPRLERLMDNL